jgi:hypothetical protein
MIESVILITAFIVGVGFTQEVVVPAGKAAVDTTVELYEKAEETVKSYTTD